MDERHLATLEFPKVLERLASKASFSAGQNRARALQPAPSIQEAKYRLETTSEARELLELQPGASIGAARDVRPQVTAATRGVVLAPRDLLEVRETLASAARLQRLLSRLGDTFPCLADLAIVLNACPDLVESVSQSIDDRANVRDGASVELGRIRREVRLANERINEKLHRIVSSPRNQPFLQEALITLRDGRYVIPLKADFRGRIRGVVHDVSASGATIYIEPLSVVDLNNAWRELQIAEEKEVERILAELSALVAERESEIGATVVALAEIDLAFAKARYAEETSSSEPHLVPRRVEQRDESDVGRPGTTVCLVAARHPLLPAADVVPIDVVLDDETFMVIITGPNTGGKTVSLKTIGLLTIMAQAGMHIPAKPGSSLSYFDEVYADIGDEQSIEQSLSTFSSHLTNILSFIDEADDGCLVLLDELGAGTDPTEGAALARALLDRFRIRRVTTFVATHYPELKTYAQLTPGVANASVEFDAETLSPTYRLSIGLPGRSNAFAIASRLGLAREIISAAEGMLSRDELRTEDMLADIHRLRIQMARARDEANAARVEADRLREELASRMDGIESERQNILAEAQAEVSEEIEGLRRELEGVRRRLRLAAAPIESVSEIETSLEEIGRRVPVQRADTRSEPAVQRGVPRRGDMVWVEPLRATGEVIEISDGDAQVQVGPARTRVKLADLELRRTAPRTETTSEQSASVRVAVAQSPGVRLDLRGLNSEDAVDRLDRHLDSAWRAGLPWIHIIHGKGTGVLRTSVRAMLRDHPLVSAYEGGGPREGGDGVTIARLVQR